MSKAGQWLSANIRPILLWVMGMILCPLGVAFSEKGGFGVSMIEAPVYVVYLKVSEHYAWYTFGMSEYILQALVLALMCVIIRRFRWKYLLSFLTAVLYGFILDGWRAVLAGGNYEAMPVRIVCAILGIVVTAFAVACFLRTWLPQEVWELFVKEVSERYHWDMTKVKWIYDLSSLALGILLMFILLGGFRWSAIGIGTLITTLVNAPIIGLFGKLLDGLRTIPKKREETHGN